MERNPIGYLQELCMARKWMPPYYSEEAYNGPAHAPSFQLSCEVYCFKVYAWAGSKKQAKKEVAWRMCKTIEIYDKEQKEEEDKIRVRPNSLPENGYIAYPEYSSFESRVNSFPLYDYPECIGPSRPTAESLAAAGFFYMGPNDESICYKCGGGIHNWNSKDDPQQVHDLYFEKCFA